MGLKIMEWTFGGSVYNRAIQSRLEVKVHLEMFIHNFNKLSSKCSRHIYTICTLSCMLGYFKSQTLQNSLEICLKNTKINRFCLSFFNPAFESLAFAWGKNAFENIHTNAQLLCCFLMIINKHLSWNYISNISLEP